MSLVDNGLRAGTYPGTVDLAQSRAAHGGTHLRLRVPRDAEPGQTIHLILRGTDDGAPALTSYRRVALTVRR